MAALTEGKSRLYYSAQSLSRCIFASIVRDTMAVCLDERDRFNYFAASPLCSITWIVEGQCRLVSDGMGEGEFLSICRKLLLVEAFSSHDKVKWFENELDALWVKVRPSKIMINNGLEDWFASLVKKTIMGKSGKSVRQVQRYYRLLTGQTKRDLEKFIHIENLLEKYMKSLKEGAVNYVELAHDAGFSDQAHMGRKLKDVTGFSPKKLNKLIATEEAFWSYRLFGNAV